MKLTLSKQHKSMIASYARSFLGASLAVYLAGVRNPGAIFAAGIAAVAPVLLRWLNAGDPAFGRGISEKS